MMGQEDWSGMFVTLGAIDKAAHMWGAQDDAANFQGNCNDPDPVDPRREPNARPMCSGERRRATR